MAGGRFGIGFQFLFPLFAVLVLSSCVSAPEIESEKEFLDLSAGRRYRGVLEQRKTPRGIRYSGFAISAIPDSDWVAPMRFQSSRRAVWGMGDPENRLHTLIAEIRISEALPGKERKRFSISTLKQAMRRSLARRSGAGRMKTFKVWSGERCGRASVEYQSESADTRSRHSGRPLTLFLRGFVVLTGENRMLSAVVSERSDDPDASQNVRAAEELLDQIRFPDSEKRCLRNKPFAISINDRG